MSITTDLGTEVGLGSLPILAAHFMPDLAPQVQAKCSASVFDEPREPDNDIVSGRAGLATVETHDLFEEVSAAVDQSSQQESCSQRFFGGASELVPKRRRLMQYELERGDCHIAAQLHCKREDPWGEWLPGELVVSAAGGLAEKCERPGCNAEIHSCCAIGYLTRCALHRCARSMGLMRQCAPLAAMSMPELRIVRFVLAWIVLPKGLQLQRLQGLQPQLRLQSQSRS